MQVFLLSRYRQSLLQLLLLGFALFASPTFAKTSKAAKPTHEKLLTFRSQTISVGGENLSAEIADTRERQSQGLMWRKELADGKAMLFPYEQEQILNFWMKNTLIPLSIGFFDANRRLVDIQDMIPGDPKLPDHLLPQTMSRAPAKYALEVPLGWFKRKKISLGAELKGFD